jgi:nucleotide-binding universal stress UspA family protein
MPATILIPIDLSQPDAGAKALAEADKYDPEAKLVLVHVLAPIPTYVTLGVPSDVLTSRAEDARKLLGALADRVGVSPDADLVIRSGHPGREIVRSAKEVNAALIVIASHDPSWGDLVLGSVAAFVVRHAHCSVFVVRDQTSQEPAN